MRRLLTGVAALLLMALAAGAADERNKTKADSPAASTPAPARAGGYFQRGGADIGRGYGHAGKEIGRRTGGFGKNVAGGEFGEAGRSFGRGRRRVR